MKKIIESIKQHKWLSAIGIVVIVAVMSVGSVIYTQQQRQVATAQRQQQALEKEKAIAQTLIANEKEVVKDNEEAIKLQNELQQAINENNQEKIATLKQQFVAKVVAIKEAQVKTVAKAEESNQNQTEDKKEEKQEEQSNSNNSTVAVNNHSSSTTNNNTTQSVKKEQPKSTTPAPAPKQEQPKKEEKKEEYYPNKYCTYNGNRQRVKNICMYGNADGLKGANEFVIRTNVNNFKTGKVEKIVWKDEPERYYLLEETGNQARLLEGLKRPSTPANAYCFVNGSCIGFDL